MKKDCRTKVVMTIRRKESPIHEEFRGYELVAALPNQAGNFRGKPCICWDKPYQVYSSVYIDKRDTERFVNELYIRGFDI